jgi:hypothetical protein
MGEKKKPKCKLAGTEGNVFALMARAEQVLNANGQKDTAVEMSKRILGTAKDYEDALRIVREYLETS